MRLFPSLSMILLMLMAIPSLTLAESPSSDTATLLFQHQMTAITSSDYEQFVSHSETAFRQAITQEQFTALSKALSGSFASGYESVNLGVLRQDSLLIHLWKVTPQQSDTDYLVKMALRDDTIAGFWIQ
ncbi:MAG: hypothetical protein V7681_16445 [Halopseudomonas sabulinigri]